MSKPNKFKRNVTDADELNRLIENLVESGTVQSWKVIYLSCGMQLCWTERPADVASAV